MICLKAHGVLSLVPDSFRCRAVIQSVRRVLSQSVLSFDTPPPSRCSSDVFSRSAFVTAATAHAVATTIATATISFASIAATALATVIISPRHVAAALHLCLLWQFHSSRIVS